MHPATSRAVFAALALESAAANVMPPKLARNRDEEDRKNEQQRPGGQQQRTEQNTGNGDDDDDEGEQWSPSLPPAWMVADARHRGGKVLSASSRLRGATINLLTDGRGELPVLAALILCCCMACRCARGRAPKRTRPPTLLHSKGIAKIANSPTGFTIHQVLAYLYASGPAKSLFLLVTTFALAGLVSACSLYFASCSDDQTFALTLSFAMLEFISYGEQGHARTKDSPGCVMISFAASVCTLLMQAFIIAFFVDRVRQPISKLCVPSRMCVLQRNGKLYLSMRLFHPHGHLLSDTVVHTVWMRPVETDEGEHFLEPEAISFEGPWDMRYIFLPALMLHPLEGSPLARYAAELNEAPVSFSSSGRLPDGYKAQPCSHSSWFRALVRGAGAAGRGDQGVRPDGPHLTLRAPHLLNG